MSEGWIGLLAALLTGLLSLAGVYMANRKSTALMEYRIGQMEKQTEKQFDEIKTDLKKHNNLVERMVKLEGRMTEAEHDICDIKRRSDRAV